MARRRFVPICECGERLVSVRQGAANGGTVRLCPACEPDVLRETRKLARQVRKEGFHVVLARVLARDVK